MNGSKRTLYGPHSIGYIQQLSKLFIMIRSAYFMISGQTRGKN